MGGNTVQFYLGELAKVMKEKALLEVSSELARKRLTDLNQSDTLFAEIQIDLLEAERRLKDLMAAEPRILRNIAACNS